MTGEELKRGLKFIRNDAIISINGDPNIKIEELESYETPAGYIVNLNIPFLSFEKAVNKRILSTALALYGKEAQTRMAIEEMAELTDAIMKKTRGRRSDEDVISEIADVTIMMQLLALMYGESAVEKEINRKLERLKARMNIGSLLDDEIVLSPQNGSAQDNSPMKFQAEIGPDMAALKKFFSP